MKEESFTVLPNENTYWFKAKKMLEEGREEIDIILYLAAVIDHLITFNKMGK